MQAARLAVKPLQVPYIMACSHATAEGCAAMTRYEKSACCLNFRHAFLG